MDCIKWLSIRNVNNRAKHKATASPLNPGLTSPKPVNLLSHHSLAFWISSDRLEICPIPCQTIPRQTEGAFEHRDFGLETAAPSSGMCYGFFCRHVKKLAKVLSWLPSAHHFSIIFTLYLSPCFSIYPRTCSIPKLCPRARFSWTKNTLILFRALLNPSLLKAGMEILLYSTTHGWIPLLYTTAYSTDSSWVFKGTLCLWAGEL